MAHLLKSQRNDVFRIIKEKGLNASDFRWEIFAHYNFGECESLDNGDGQYFDFLSDGDLFYWEYSPGREMIVEQSSIQIGHSWSVVRTEVNNWLANLKKEISEPDLWANLPETSDSLWDFKEPDIENLPFSNDEQEIVVQGIQEIRNFVIGTGVSNTELKLLDDKLDYLIESSTKLGRKDWILIVTGTLVSIVASHALDSISAKTLFEVAGKALNQLYQGMLLLPQ